MSENIKEQEVLDEKLEPENKVLELEEIIKTINSEKDSLIKNIEILNEEKNILKKEKDTLTSAYVKLMDLYKKTEFLAKNNTEDSILNFVKAISKNLFDIYQYQNLDKESKEIIGRLIEISLEKMEVQIYQPVIGEIIDYTKDEVVDSNFTDKYISEIIMPGLIYKKQNIVFKKAAVKVKADNNSN